MPEEGSRFRCGRVSVAGIAPGDAPPPHPSVSASGRCHPMGAPPPPNSPSGHPGVPDERPDQLAGAGNVSLAASSFISFFTCWSMTVNAAYSQRSLGTLSDHRALHRAPTTGNSNCRSTAARPTASPLAGRAPGPRPSCRVAGPFGLATVGGYSGSVSRMA